MKCKVFGWRLAKVQKCRQRNGFRFHCKTWLVAVSVFQDKLHHHHFPPDINSNRGNGNNFGTSSKRFRSIYTRANSQLSIFSLSRYKEAKMIHWVCTASAECAAKVSENMSCGIKYFTSTVCFDLKTENENEKKTRFACNKFRYSLSMQSAVHIWKIEFT